MHENKKKELYRKSALNVRDKRISRGTTTDMRRETTKQDSSDSSENEIEEPVQVMKDLTDIF